MLALLSEEGRAVRVTEISQALGVKKPSVTSALKKLSEQGLVEHERYRRAALGQRLTPQRLLLLDLLRQGGHLDADELYSVCLCLPQFTVIHKAGASRGASL